VGDVPTRSPRVAAHVPRRLRWAVWLPLLAVATCVVALGIVGLLLDVSGLQAPPDSFGFVLSVGFLVAALVPVPAGLTLATGIGGSLASSPRTIRRWAVGGAYVTSLTGLLAVAGAFSMARDEATLSGDLFAGALGVVGLVLQVPMASLFRTRWSTRS